ncbi:MAG: hemolysin family protein [Salibacteraceae bacterium]|mgnify:CR=1 FL=1
MPLTEVLVIVVSLIFSAFFSGMEMAFVSSNKLKIESDKKTGALPGRIYSYFIKHESKFISTLLLGNNVALVVYGIFMARLLEPSIREYLVHSEIGVLLLQTLISTLLILLTAEFLPKTYFRINPNDKLTFWALPVALFCGPIFFLIVYPAVAVPGFFARWLFNVDLSESKLVFGKVDLDNYVKEATEQADDEEILEHEIQIFRKALDFTEVKARECMVPRTEIVALEVHSEVETLREKFIETGLSKILIYRETIDNIIGYTHSFELFKRPEAIKNILLPIAIVPETMPGKEVLEQFIKQKRNVAVVLDEFGGTSGMLTLEDVVEEIFGEIEDEHDQEEHTEKQLDVSTYLLAARLEIDYLREKYKLDLPISEDYETLAGLIISIHEDIPEVGEKIRMEGFVCTIKEVSNNRIELVELRVLAEFE